MFSFFLKSSSFPRAFHVGAGKRVWKLHPDLYESLLLIEIRGTTLPEVSFIAVDTDTQTVVQPEFQIAGGWWCAVNAVAGGIIYITRYEGTHSPEPTAIQAYHIAQQKILWEKKEMRFSEATSKGVALFPKYLSDAPLLFDAQTGAEIPAIALTEKRANLLLPYHYPETDAYFGTVAEFLRTKSINNLVGAIDYQETDNTILTSYYVKKDKNSLTNKLHAFDKSGKVIWSEVLAENLTGIGDETFFVLNHNVIFVRNKQSVCIKTIP